MAGGLALLLGVGGIVAAACLGYAGGVHFDGVLDAHWREELPLWGYVAEGLIDWLSLALVLWILGRVVSKSAFRAVDLFGTQALARWPSVLIALLMLPGAFRRACNDLLQQVLLSGGGFELHLGSLLVFGLTVLACLLLVIWMVCLMYQSYSLSCNVRGGKAVGSFAGGLIGAEILSKVLVVLLVLHVSSNRAAAARASAAGTNAVAAAVPEAAARAAAQRWTGLLDAGNYGQSWQEACPLFQKAMSESGWAQALRTYRQPLGKMLSRRIKSTQSASSLPGLLGGTAYVMQFDTSFEKKSNAVETVTFQQQPDGSWKAAGYFIK